MKLFENVETSIVKRATPAAAWVWWNLPEEEKNNFLKEILPNIISEDEWPIAVSLIEELFIDILSADDFEDHLNRFNAVEKAKATKNYCKRCGGAGFLTRYKQINGGRCFDCGGTGKLSK